MADPVRDFKLTRTRSLGSLIARLKKILKLSSPQRVQLVRLRTRSITDSLHSRLSMARRFPGRGLDSVLAVAYERRSAQWRNVFDGAVRICKKKYFLVTTYYTMTKRILLLAAVLGVGLLAQPSIYAQEKKAAAAPSPAAATTEAKTTAKKSAKKTTHHAKKAAKKEASPSQKAQ